MKKQIIVQIDCEDDVRCGECIGVTTDPDNEYCAWAEQNWDESHKGPFMKNLGDTRGPLCLAAEQRLRDLVEAGKVLRNLTARGPSLHDLGRASEYVGKWDAALAAIKGEE